MEFETRAIHAGQDPDPATGAVITPIYQTSTYVQEEVGVNKGYDYSRTANPTRAALEEALASLEGAEHGIAFSSGLGATTTIMHLVDPGERVVLIADVYGGVYRMTSQVYEPKGYRFTYVPADEFDESLASHLDDDTQLVWVETPSNPLLNVVDIRRAADAAHAAGALLAVDNTFASPYLQQPLALGADLVVHSTTKYLGGHSDVIGGAVAHERRRARRAAALPAELARRRARAVRRVARPARAEDARAPDASGTARTPARSPASSRSTRRSSGCSTPASRAIPATRWRGGRCATSAAWSRSSSRPRSRRSRSPRGRSSSSSPSRSAASRA